MPTPMRTFRADDELWEAVTAAAEAEGTDTSEFIRNALRAALRAGGAVLVAVVALAGLTACGGADAPAAGTTVEQTQAVPEVAVTNTPVATLAPVSRVGEAQILDGVGTINVTQLEPGVYSVELMTSSSQILDGQFVATDSAGAQHVGASLAWEQYGTGLRANGYGGDRVTFDTTDVETITYTGNGAVLAWTA